MSNMNQIASGLYKALTESDKRKPKPYDTKAEVLRIEGNIVWVKIPGGTDETPVSRTNNANPGDQVMVRISGGRAWLLGNETAPATDDTVANYAVEQSGEAVDMANISRIAAEVANAAANDAVRNAAIAKEVTDEIVKYAETAEKTVTQILDDGEKAGAAAQRAETKADEAKGFAEDANRAANGALTSLGIVEDVVGTLNWISDHGYYQLSTDTEVVENRVYYTATGTAIQNPSGNPSYQRYYERSGSGTEQDPYIYTKSNDAEVVTGKTYYTLAVTTVAEPTGSPADNLYYILVIDDSVHNYISTHLALTESGLNIFGTNTMGRLQLTPNGVEIYPAGSNNMVAQYGSSIRLGNEKDRHITIDNTKLVFWTGTESQPENKVAWFDDNKLHIPNAVVTDNLITGRWMWDASSNPNRLDLKYRGEQ